LEHKLQSSIPAPSPNPASANKSVPDETTTEVHAPTAPEPVQTPPKPASLPSHFAACAGTEAIIEEEEEDVLDVSTPDTGHDKINVQSKEAILHEKNFNIENQIECCFKRTQELFKMHATDSKAMIEDAVRERHCFRSK
jgi:hypothetical protein